jgi:hypothetical protein
MTNIYSKPVMVDPPGGHRYGFPKLYDPSKEEGTMFDWLVREGYPQSEIDRYGKQNLYCTFWYPEEEDYGKQNLYCTFWSTEEEL